MCSHRCLIADGRVGFCAVRKNIDGVLYSLNYYKVCSANVDPIEKKPLFHFQPGSKSFSIATVGCNFRCDFCQNWQISQAAVEARQNRWTGDKPAKDCRRGGSDRLQINRLYIYRADNLYGVVRGDGRLAKKKGLANVFVSNGYQTKEAIDFAKDWLDGINVDLKAFSEDYYKRLCKAKLQPVLDTIEYIAKNTNIWMEITTLLGAGRK